MGRFATGSESDITLKMYCDAILAELLEIEGILLDDRLNDDDWHALHGAAQALRHLLDAATWQPASQTVLSGRRPPSEARIHAGALSGPPLSCTQKARELTYDLSGERIQLEGAAAIPESSLGTGPFSMHSSNSSLS